MQRENLSPMSDSQRRTSTKKGEGSQRSVPSTTEHLDALQTNPLGRWMEGQAVVQKADQSSENRRIDSLCIAFAFAMIASQNKALMDRFIKNSFWMNGHKPKVKDILRRSMEYHFNCTVKEGALYNRCRVYSLALSEFFEAGTPVNELPALIRAQGYTEELYRQAYNRMRQAKREAKATHSGAIEDGRDNIADIDSDDDDANNDTGDDGGEADTRTSSKGNPSGVESKGNLAGDGTTPASGQNTIPRTRPYPFDPDREVACAVDRNQMATFLAKDEGETGTLEYRVDKRSKVGWLSIAVIHLK